MNYHDEEIEINLLELVHALWRKAVIVICATIVGALVFGLYSYYLIVPTYKSTAMIYIVSGSSDSLINLSELQISSNLTSDYIVLIKSRPVVEEVIENLQLDLEYEEMVEKMGVATKDDTRIIDISITDTDPTMSEKIANEFAKVAQKQIPVTMRTSEPTIVEEAVEGAKIGPSLLKNTIIGALLGFVLCAGIVIVLYIMDDSIKSTEDIERYLQLNTLAAIPEEGGTDNSEKKSKKKHKLTGVKNHKSGKGGKK